MITWVQYLFIGKKVLCVIVGGVVGYFLGKMLSYLIELGMDAYMFFKNKNNKKRNRPMVKKSMTIEAKDPRVTSVSSNPIPNDVKCLGCGRTRNTAFSCLLWYGSKINHIPCNTSTCPYMHGLTNFYVTAPKIWQ